MGKFRKATPPRISRGARLAAGRTAPAGRLQAERIARGWSQEHVARLLEQHGVAVTSRYVGYIETGHSRPTDRVLSAFAGVYGVSLAELGAWLVTPPRESAA